MIIKSTVTLTILKHDKERLEGMLNYTFLEIDWAIWGFESKLQDEKIPYEKSWGQGNEYGDGTEHHRINKDGISIIQQFEGNQEGFVSLQDVINAYECGDIENYIANMKSSVNPISWDEQNKIFSTLA